MNDERRPTLAELRRDVRGDICGQCGYDRFWTTHHLGRAMAKIECRRCGYRAYHDEPAVPTDVATPGD
jgi:ribosomal protein L37E